MELEAKCQLRTNGGWVQVLSEQGFSCHSAKRLRSDTVYPMRPRQRKVHVSKNKKISEYLGHGNWDVMAQCLGKSTMCRVTRLVVWSWIGIGIGTPFALSLEFQVAYHHVMWSRRRGLTWLVLPSCCSSPGPSPKAGSAEMGALNTVIGQQSRSPTKRQAEVRRTTARQLVA